MPKTLTEIRSIARSHTRTALNVLVGVMRNTKAPPPARMSESNAIMQYRIAEIGHWYEPDKLMGYFVAVYFGKLLVFDKVLGLGTTDPLAGFASVTSNLVVSFYFAKRGFENVARIIKR
jgi:hypothetical protein